MRKVLLLLGVLTCFLLSGYTGAGEASAGKGLQDDKVAARFTTWNVTMGGSTNTFDPPALPNVKVGDCVTFTNAGGTHTATSVDITTGDPKNTFNTGTMKKGQVTSIFFNNAGTYSYKCAFHATMTGTITVTAP